MEWFKNTLNSNKIKSQGSPSLSLDEQRSKTPWTDEEIVRFELIVFHFN